MKLKTISIIGIILIVIAAIGVTAVYFNTNSNEKTILNITNDENLTNGDLLTVKLSNESNIGVANKTINIIFTDSTNNITKVNVTTDSQGFANYTIDFKPDNYTVNATFNGDKNYKPSQASQNLTIEEIIIQSISVESVSQTSSNYQSSPTSNVDNYGEEIIYSTDPNSDKSVIDENGHIDQDLVDKYNQEAREKYGPIG